MQDALCEEGGRPDTLIRIPCHELEAWFLGDLRAVGQAFECPNVERLQQKRKYRSPDAVVNAEEELIHLIGSYQKVGGARLIAPFLDPDRNRSHSFCVFVSGLRDYVSTTSSPLLR